MRKHRGEEVTISYMVEVAVEITCRVSGGDPGRTYGPPEKCYPPEAAEVELLCMRSESGANLDSLMDEFGKADLAAIEELAIEAAGDRAAAAWDAAEEARADAARERWD